MDLPASVSVVQQHGRTIYLVGTAHVSQQSVEDVRQVIDLVEPDTVCVELCQQRYDALTDEDRWKKLDLIQVIRQGKVLMLLANLSISAWQRKIGAELGVEPGSELLEAAKIAIDRDAELCLIDRDIQITLRRTWSNLRLRDRFSMIAAIFNSFFEDQEVSAEDIEQLKDQSNLDDMLTKFAEAFPRVKGPLIDERDHYMAGWLKSVEGDKIVAVVGAAHVPGIIRCLKGEEEPTPRETLDVMPPKSKWGKALMWMIPVLVLGGFVYGISREEPRSMQELLLAWIIPNMALAGLFTAIARGKLASIITASVSSPITSLNPLLNTGMTTGLVETWARKPTVDDVSRLPVDTRDWQGFKRNKVTRVLLVSVASMMGSALGAYAGLFLLVYLNVS